MGFSKVKREKIRHHLLESIRDKRNPYKEALELYKVTRQTVYKYLKTLEEEEGLIEKKSGSFELKFYNIKNQAYKNSGLEEDIIYDKLLKVFMKDKINNVKEIYSYAVSEMLNNAIEHSEATKIDVLYMENYFYIYTIIKDNGIGIFKKIVRDHDIENEDVAIFELKKGKLTSDAENHSGEGIFFTSRVVDYFQLDSFGKKFYAGNLNRDYHLEKNRKKLMKGTRVLLVLDKNTRRITENIFKEYTDENYKFNRTEILVSLAKQYTEASFISRSIARRILDNLEKFEIITLDFLGVSSVGQAFADEIMRVFPSKHEKIKLIPINMNEKVKFMIERARIK